MNKQFKLSLLCSAIILAGCGDDTSISGVDSNAPYEEAINESLARASSINFTLSGSDAAVPLPSYLLFNTNDHTLELPLTADSSGGLDDPLVAMGEADGWSTIMPFSIGLDLPTGVTIKNDTLSLLSGVKLAKVTMDLATGVMSDFTALTAGVDYVVMASSDLKSINVVPMAGLDPSSDYIYALTDDLLDSNDEPLGTSRSYAMLKTQLVDQEGDLDTPQKLTQQMEALFAGFGEVSSTDKIIYSSWFTTASAGNVLQGTKAAIATALNPLVTPAGVWKGTANPNGLDSTVINSLYSITVGDGEAFGDAVTTDPLFINAFGTDTATLLQTNYNLLVGSGALDSIDVYRGTVNLPYFLSDDVTGAWASTPWRSGMPSVFKIINTLSSGSDEDKLAISTQLAQLGFTQLPDQLYDPAHQAKLVGAQLTLANGEQLDSDRILTRYSAVPQLRSVKTVPFIMFVPKRADLTSVELLQYQHGITSIKESSFLFAMQHMSGAIQAGAQPYAVIAIDQPLHGERKLSDDIITTPEDPTVYMNLAYLPVARDNIRQGAMDTLGLRVALNSADTTQGGFSTIDTSTVSLFGHSIGAITGIGSYSAANTPLDPTVDGLFSYKTATFANPGGGIAPFLLESESFSPTIKHSVVVASVPQYKAYYDTSCAPAEIEISDGDCFTDFYGALNENEPDQAALKAGIDSGLASFSYAAQTVLDNVDPYNIAPSLSGSILGIQSDGDKTIPNSVVSNPSAGTEPLFSQMSLVNTALDASGSALASYFDANSNAEHSSVLAPGTVDEAAANAEMTSQIVQFTLSGGNIMVDGSLLDASK